MTFLEELLNTAVRDGDITVNISKACVSEPDLEGTELTRCTLPRIAGIL